MKIKTFIFIFLIFSQNFIVIIKSCETISIDRRDYKLYIFNEGVDHIPEDTVGDKKIFAFNYNFFNGYRDNIKSDIFMNIGEIVKKEKRKVTPGLFHYILDKIFPSDRNESEFKETCQQIRTFKDNEINEKLDEYNTIKEGYSNIISAGQKTIKNSLVGGTVTFSANKILPILAEKLLDIKELSKLTLSNPYTVGILFGAYFIFEVGSKIYNWSIDCGIQKDKNEIYKLTKLYFSIQEQIKTLYWIGNNMVLTAKSKDKSCPKFVSKFDYYDGIKYRNLKETENYMANLTCVFRLDNCDYLTCRRNLKQYMICKKKEERGEVEDCPTFMDDCSLVDI